MKKTLFLAALAVFTLSATNSFAGGKEKEKSKKECAKACTKEAKPSCCMKKEAGKAECAPKAK